MASKLLKKFAETLAKDQMDSDPPAEPVVQNPKVFELVRLLTINPLLVEPTRRFIHQKIREINGATLSVLYSQDEIDALVEKSKQS